MSRWYRLGTVLIGATLTLGTLAACGGTSSSGGNVNKNLVIATELAVSGADASAQVPAQHGADLAIMQNKNLGKGYKLDFKHDNYEGTNGVDPAIGATNVTALVADPTVVSVVGPFNSGVAKVTIPIAQQGGLVLLSPTNTNPGLTLQQYAAANGINFSQLHPAGIPDYYFRLPGNDVVQGKVDAQLAAAAPLNAKTVYVTDDDTTYGKGLANYFVQVFAPAGCPSSACLGRTSITPANISSLPSLAATIAGLNPDIVFYGGVTSGGGPELKKDLVAKGYTKPMVGGDGIASDPGWVTGAGPAAAVNTFGSVAAPDLSQFTGGAGAEFVTDYKAAFPGQDITPYSALTYDATMVEITAIKNLIKADKAVTRSAIRDQIAGIQYTGITGSISFDANGDNAGNKVFSIYGVTAASNGQWVFIEQVSA